MNVLTKLLRKFGFKKDDLVYGEDFTVEQLKAGPRKSKEKERFA